MNVADPVEEPSYAWTCAVLGAREHYLIPRSLHSLNQLHCLITDTWIRPNSFLGKLIAGKRLKSRFHADLCHAPVYDATLSALWFELVARGTHTFHQSDWKTVLSRAKWFDSYVQDYLQKNAGSTVGNSNQIFFAYSYSASDAIAKARETGFKTVLGQIDGGPYEEALMLAEQQKYPALSTRFQAAPAEYWKRWEREIHVADRIVVNSCWAAHCLAESGVPPEKIRNVPLSFHADRIVREAKIEKKLPKHFSAQRRLRVLFLGQVVLRKGIGPLFEAIRKLQHYPIQFQIVGPIGVSIPEDLRKHSNCNFLGPVSRAEVAKYYEEADVFILPTISDGFALTQLEAQAFGLPLIVSRNCGEVVTNGVDGIVLAEISCDSIVEALLDIVANPDALEEMSAKISPPKMSPNAYAEKLSGVVL